MKKLIIFTLLSLSLLAQQTVKYYDRSVGLDEIVLDMKLQIKNGWKVVDSTSVAEDGGYSSYVAVTYEKISTTTTTVSVKFKDIPNKIAEVSKTGWIYVDKIQNSISEQEFILIFKKEN